MPYYEDNSHIVPIIEATAALAATREGATATTSAVIECMVAAASTLISGMFRGGTMQERLLFTLSLAGACANLSDQSVDGSDGFALEVAVNPQTLTEAMNVYTILTGKSIRKYLPPSMLAFADSAKQRVLN